MDPIESITSGTQGGAPTELGAAEGAAQAAPPAHPFLDAFTQRLKRLIEPNPAIPENYQGKWVATAINSKLGVEAEAALLGESANLCLDVLLEGSMGDLPPIAHFGWSTIKFFKFKKDGVPQQESQPAQPGEVKTK